MLVQDLRSMLLDARALLAVAGNAKAADAIEELTAALEDKASEDAESFFERLRQQLQDHVPTAVVGYASQLQHTGLSEARFLDVWNQIATDKSVKKADLQSIMHAYAGRVDKKATAAQLLEDLKRAFYTRLYDRDAQAMANSSTPW
jgi:hypothetical protein